MQQPKRPNDTPVVVSMQPINNQTGYMNMKNGLAKQLLGFGVVQVVIGVLCIIFQGIGVGIRRDSLITNIEFVVFWHGVFFIITGSFGISAGIGKKRWQVVTFNVLSITSAVVAASLAIISAVNCVIAYSGNENNCNDDFNYQYHRQNCTNIKTGIAMGSLLSILGLIEGIVAICSSIVCCCDYGGSCCCPSSVNPEFTMQPCQPMDNASQQTVVNGNTQSTKQIS